MKRHPGWWKISVCSLLGVCCSLGHAIAWADVPKTISYQGKLTESDGSPLVGEHTVVLRLYDAATAGIRLWEEQHAISLARGDNGVFVVLLGSRTPFGSSITFNSPLWLTIELDGAGEFSPRQPLSAVGYAINADTLDGLDSSKFLTAADLPAAATPIQVGAGLSGGGSGATVDIGAGTGIIVGEDAVNVDVGTAPGKIVQLDAAGALPEVSGEHLTALDASHLASGTVPDARLSATISLLGQTIETAELAPNSVGASALASDAIQPGDIGVGDLPAHAGTHQPGSTDALPTAAAVDIGSSNGSGASAAFARADHLHEGLHSLAVQGQPEIHGDAVLVAGSNVTLSQTGQAITIGASGAGSSGNRASDFASNALTIGTASDTTLLSVAITKSHASSILLVLCTVQINHSANPIEKTVDVKLFRDATQLDASYTVRLGTSARSVSEIPVSLQAWDTSGAGTYTFSLKARASGTGAQATVRRLTVIEVL